MIASVLYLTQLQQLSVAGLNIYSVRFLELAGFLRVMMRHEFSFSTINRLDKTLIVLYVFTAVVYCLRTTEDCAYIIGSSVDAFLCYFTFRGLVRGAEDFFLFLRDFLLLLAPYAALVMVECVTHHNAFSFIGGGMYDWTRGDRFRCVGSFRNPDLLGTLGATFAPLYVAMICANRERKLAIAGLVLCLWIVWASNSGGPMCTVGITFIGWALWRMRTRMQLFRRGLACGLILLAIVMKAPIWYLLSRISEITGGDGYHRALLIDVSVQHLSKWWLAGMPILDTSDWFAYSLSTGADICNTFISFGLNAGLGAMILLILLLVRAFSAVGNALDSIDSGFAEPTAMEFLLWGFGAMLAGHIANWLGITYFDQSYVMWFMQLAAVSSVTASCLQNATEQSLEPELPTVETGMQFEHEAS